MKESEIAQQVFPTAGDDADAALRVSDTPQTRSPSYRLAYDDSDFLLRDELRPVRLQLELLKPELLQQENGIKSTIVIFGSTRIPDATTANTRLQEAEALVDEGTIGPSDLDLFQYVETAEQAWDAIQMFQVCDSETDH